MEAAARLIAIVYVCVNGDCATIEYRPKVANMKECVQFVRKEVVPSFLGSKNVGAIGYCRREK